MIATHGMHIETFNTASRDDAIAAIKPCLDIARWIDVIVDARPYVDVDALLQHARSAAEPFMQAEIDAALAHHPRIGERARGSGDEAKFSSAEQAGLGAASHAVEDALAILVNSYDALRMPELRDDAKRVLDRNFPNSDAPQRIVASDDRSWWQVWR